MKIQCDVCEKDEASLFCIADEAALCSACDHRVHHANKLAGKHQRFSLHHPSPKQAPLCDICQERRAYLFCQQDRAILCRECDIPIHTTNHHTQNHTRFLLTGIRLSPSPSLYSPSPSPSPAQSASSNLTDKNSNKSPSNAKKPERTQPVCVIAAERTPPPADGTTLQSAAAPDKSNNGGGVGQLMSGFSGGSVSTSSISEYLEMVPGWHVEDFLHSDSSPSTYGFSENGESELLGMRWDDGDLGRNMMGGGIIIPTENNNKMGFLSVPQVQQQQQNQCMEMGLIGYGFIEQSKEFNSTFNNNNNNNNNCNSYNNMRRGEDNCFAVPQINTPHSSVSKRSRTFY